MGAFLFAFYSYFLKLKVMVKILVIEDNLDLRDFFTMFLQMNNFEVESTSSGKGVFTRLNTFMPDVILLDVLLGKNNGRDICKEIKEKYKGISVILLSANPKLLMDHDECNADDVIEKPFNNQDILDKIKKALKTADII
jgi:two-component system, OmpR family, phosphate regulon response regulator PhoB